MTKKMGKNILFLASWYPTRVHPTNGNFIQKHARCLLPETNIFALHVCEDRKMKKAFEKDFGNIDEVPHLIIYFRSPIQILKPIYKLIAYCQGFFWVRKNWLPIDLIHLNVIMDAGLFLWLTSFFYKIPFVATEHSSSYLQQNWHRISRFKKFWVIRITRLAKYVLPVSKNLEENLKKFGVKSSFEVIPNIVNTDLFALKKPKAEKLKFLHISNFHPVKNVKGMLRCVKKLSELRTDFTFTIAGDGDLKPLKNYAKELQIDNGILNFMGKMTESEVAQVMREHDVFVLFSDTENLPVVLLEAQSCGLPIISSTIGGTPEIVSSKKLGELVKPKDEEKLLEKMLLIMDSFGDYDSQFIRKKAVDLYAEKKIKNQLLTIYQKAMQGE